MIILSPEQIGHLSTFDHLLSPWLISSDQAVFMEHKAEKMLEVFFIADSNDADC